jgi:hypothetical protein
MANGRSQGLQVAVIIFAILTVISTVVAVVMWKSKSDHFAEFEDAKSAAQKADQVARQANDDLRRLKKLIRSDFESSSFAELATFGAGEVLTAGSIYDDLNQLAADTGTEPYRDYSHALEGMYDRVDNLTAQLNNLQADNVDMERNNVNRDQVTTAEINVHEKAKKTAELDLADREGEFLAAINEKQAQTDDFLSKAEQAIAEREQLRLDAQQRQAQDGETIQQQRNRIALLNEELADFKEASFERADGQIVYVSSRLGLVWIKLGSDDNLPKQQTFSVYSASEMNVAKKRKKADIEVTSIRGPHLAEARITNHGASPGDPILEGDVIYTPLWSPGRKLRFAVAGLIDLDGDGEDDRQTVRDVIHNGGGVIVAELQHDGQIETHFGGIDINTKYLILGNRPEVEGVQTTDDSDSKIADYLRGISRLVEQSRNAGVEIISVERFLELVGYQPHMRLVKPGSIRTSSPRPAAGSLFGERGRERQESASRLPGSILGGAPSRTAVGGY